MRDVAVTAGVVFAMAIALPARSVLAFPLPAGRLLVVSTLLDAELGDGGFWVDVVEF